jgi:hypothetical protein
MVENPPRGGWRRVVLVLCCCFVAAAVLVLVLDDRPFSDKVGPLGLAVLFLVGLALRRRELRRGSR